MFNHDQSFYKSDFFWHCDHSGNTRIHQNESDKKKGYIAGVPIIKKGAYKDDFMTLRNSDFEDTGFTIMRGSKASIKTRYGERVYEYDYHFFYWLGKRFAKHINKKGCKILEIKTKRYLNPSHRGIGSICDDNFNYGFYSNIEDKTLKARIVQRGLSSIYFICYKESNGGDAFRQHNIINDILSDLIDISEIEKKGATTK